MSTDCEASGLQNTRERQRCRITVLRKDFNAELYELCPYGAKAPCSRHHVGQSFVTDSRWDPPSGFCAWAWGDIRPLVMAVHGGEKVPMVACCTDGIRPVFFKLEREVSAPNGSAGTATTSVEPAGNAGCARAGE